MRKLIIIFILLTCISCKEDVLPKPEAYLSLQYPKPTYINLSLKRPYDFQVPQHAIVLDEKKDWLKIQYPMLKASIDITYRPVENNLIELLTEAEKLVFKHAVKAEQILPKDFTNYNKKVFGTLYEITGNAASHIQFHLTDSTSHFLKGSLYFSAKPNYDSILPAVDYIKSDISVLMESIEWIKTN